MVNAQAFLNVHDGGCRKRSVIVPQGRADDNYGITSSIITRVIRFARSFIHLSNVHRGIPNVHETTHQASISLFSCNEFLYITRFCNFFGDHSL